MSEIALYPSNWLYNAGVVGFLSCLDRYDYLQDYPDNEKKYSFEDNCVAIYNQVFSKIQVASNYFENGRVINLKGRNHYYRNFIDATGNQKWVFEKFVKALSDNHNSGECYLCNNGIYVKKENIHPQNTNQTQENIDKFFNKIEGLNMAHNSILGPALLEPSKPPKFPNAYWNLNDKFKICHLCAFIIIHHHLALTKLSDESEIFINAPSFKVMYEMNKLVKELFGKEKLSGKQKREILAMSVIEYSRRLNVSLGMWNQMNLEIIQKSFQWDYSQGGRKKNFTIDSYSLPYHIVNLISDRKIASLLSEIGEFSVLNIVLNGEEKRLIDIGNKLIRIGLKPFQDRNKNDKAVLNNLLQREKNKNNIINTAQKILELYVNISERRKIYA